MKPISFLRIFQHYKFYANFVFKIKIKGKKGEEKTSLKKY